VEEYRADPERLRLPRRLVAETPALAAAASRARLDWEVAIAEALGRRFGEDPGGRLRAEMMAGAIAAPVRVAIRAWEDSDYRTDPRPLAAQGLEMVGRGLAETQEP
jgi:MftR C-terminal domain